MTAIGERIKTLREERGLTQLEMSQKLEIADVSWSPVTLSKVESGRRRVLAEDLPGLCQVLGVHTSDLLDELAFMDQVQSARVARAEGARRLAQDRVFEAERGLGRAREALAAADRELDLAHQQSAEYRAMSQASARRGGEPRDG